MNSGEDQRLPIGFFLWTGVAQLIGFTVGVLLGPQIGVSGALSIHTLSSVTLARFAFRLPLPWVVLNLTLPIGAAWALQSEQIIWPTAGISILLVLVFLPAIWTRIPYYPTAATIYEAVAAELPQDRPFRFIDLGCGGGALLQALAQLRPNGHFTGIELGPLPFLVAKVRAAMSTKHQIEIKNANLWSYKLDQYDFAYAFLAPPPMKRLWQQASANMRPGAILIVNSFAIPEITPEKIVRLTAGRQDQLYLYRIPRMNQTSNKRQ